MNKFLQVFFSILKLVRKNCPDSRTASGIYIYFPKFTDSFWNNLQARRNSKKDAVRSIDPMSGCLK